MMNMIKKYGAGIAVSIGLACIAQLLSSVIPGGIISGGVFALLIGMLLHPFVSRFTFFSAGFAFVSKYMLQLSIILLGLTLHFSQVVLVGKYSLMVMVFTLAAAFLGGYLLGKLFRIDWKLAGLISAGAGICGGAAIAAIAPTIHAKDKDIAYAISTTFLFGVIMVIVLPTIGRWANMTDMGFGLWAGTAVNDTSSVVATAYAFSDAAGQYATIVKLTRTLSLIPVVFFFSLAEAYTSQKVAATGQKVAREKINLKKIFPFFILLFLAMVALKSTGIVPDSVSAGVGDISKFVMVMALGAIGLKINLRDIAKSGFLPLIHGFLLSGIVVVVSFFVQSMLGQL